MAEENPFARLFTRQVSTVRLGTIRAGHQKEALQIDLINADPTDTKYDCLSYDRSTNIGSVEVEVEGVKTALPKQLDSALRKLRKDDRPRTLWADLLIGNTAEDRSTQAAEMKTVFQHVETVIAWLGLEDAKYDAAADMLENLANRWYGARLHTKFPDYQNRATPQQMMGAHSFLASQPAEDLKLFDDKLWKMMQEVFDSAYFRTTQSIPEIILAKTAVVAVGTKTISWEDFTAALMAYLMLAPTHRMELSPTFMDAHQRISRLELATLRKRNGDSLELLAMLKDTRRTSSSDPRELIYSLLPIITPCERTKGTERRPAVPVADYTKDVVQVYKEASRYIVEERQDVLTWSFGERPPCGRKQTKLPSWALDCGTPTALDGSYTTTNASNGLRAWADPLQHKKIYVDSEDALHIQAHPLDRVLHISKTFTQENCRRLCLEEMQQVPRIGGTESAASQLDRIARTICLNQGMGMQMTNAPPADLVNSFQSVLAEERILSLLNCTLEELSAQPPNPELMARIASNEMIQTLRPLTGQSQAFEELLRRNAIGRRFFRTEGGRIGMTADETPPPDEADAPPVPNFDQAMSDPLAHHMMAAFQQHVARQNPEMANILSQALNGNLSGQRAPGVRSGDLIVAVVGGYSPYVLREPEGRGEGVALKQDGKYSFVGDCYVHGVMEGECFKEKAWLSLSSRYSSNIPLTDIRIV